MPAYRIYLIRHGLTEANFSGKYIGETDVDLCEQGAASLLSLKEQYEYPNVGRVYTSPLKRSIQSARLIYPHMTPVTVSDLREYSFGEFENKTTEELKELPSYRAWLDSAQQTVPPHAEDPAAFSQRVLNGLDAVIHDMMKDKISDAAVFTHAGVITALLCACGLPKCPYAEWAVESGCGFTLSINAWLWGNEHLFEVFTPVPYGKDTDSIMLDYQKEMIADDE